MALDWLQLWAFLVIYYFLWKLGKCEHTLASLTESVSIDFDFSGSSIDDDDYDINHTVTSFLPSSFDMILPSTTEYSQLSVNAEASLTEDSYVNSAIYSSTKTVQLFTETSFSESRLFQEFSSTLPLSMTPTKTSYNQQLVSLVSEFSTTVLTTTDTLSSLIFDSLEFLTASNTQIITASTDSLSSPSPLISNLLHIELSLTSSTLSDVTETASSPLISNSLDFPTASSTQIITTSTDVLHVFSPSSSPISFLLVSEISLATTFQELPVTASIGSTTFPSTVIFEINQTSTGTNFQNKLSTLITTGDFSLSSTGTSPFTFVSDYKSTVTEDLSGTHSLFSLSSSSDNTDQTSSSLIFESSVSFTQEESYNYLPSPSRIDLTSLPLVISSTSITDEVKSSIFIDTGISSSTDGVVYSASYSFGTNSVSVVPFTASEFTESVLFSISSSISTLLTREDVIVNSFTVNPSSSLFIASTTDITILPTSTIASKSLLSSPLPLPTPVTTIPVVMVTSVNATAILVVWSPVPGASGYLIILSQEGARLKRNTAMEIQVQGNATSYTVNGLLPYTSYTIRVASYDANNVRGLLSEVYTIRTNETIPGRPINVTWISIGNNLLNVSWLPPIYPNGIITAYIVTIFESDMSSYHYNVSGIVSVIIRKPTNNDFYIVVSAVNSVGTSEPQNATMISIVDDGTIPSVSKLSGGAIAGIVIVCILVVGVIIVGSVILILFLWKRLDSGDGVDEKVGEMEYKTDLEQSTNTYITCMDEEDVGSASQLTAKRWMRANANYSTPSALLPSIADLVRSYSTAEDVVKNKTINRPYANGLNTILESQKGISGSNNSSSERSRDAPSTLSSVCSKHNCEVKKVAIPYESHVLSEREAGMRESEIADGNHPLFEMMENIYVPATFDMESLQQYHLDPSLLEVKEQVGVGEHCKIFVGIAELLPFERNEEVVAVKMLKDESDEEDFFAAAHILSQFSHDNILNLLAITHSSPMVIIPFMELADLKRYLVKVRRRTRLEHQPCNFDVCDQLSISLQIAGGMEYLSSKFYIHRALQSKYILLDEDFCVKISGFQMSLALGRSQKYQELKENGKLPCKWLSMETLIDGRFTPYTDIWSFGVVMWEIFAYGLTPFRGVQNNEVVNHLRNGERLNKPSDCSEDVYTLMLHCWNERCRERPSFSELRQHLAGILETTKRTMNQGLEEQNTNEFNTFDFQGISDTVPQECTPEEVVILNNEPNLTLDPVESASDVEMAMVVLRNDISASVRNEDQSRNSNQSSIPELVLSNQPPQESEVDLSTAQLLSTEEYTVL